MFRGHSIDAHVHRHEPTLGDIGRRVERKTTLIEHQLIAFDRRGDERIPRLPDPGIHQRAHRLTAPVAFHRCFDGVPQVRGLGVPIAVSTQIVADAITETFVTQILLEHPKNRATLFVGQHVEHAFAVVRRTHLEFDRTSARQRVGVERGRTIQGECRPTVPVRPVGGTCRDFHEGCECFVQPDAVPPLHGDEVTEPHVRQFVTDDIGHQLLFGLGAGGGIDQQQRFAIGDATDVLHGAGGEVWQGHHVDLGVGIRNSVIVDEPLQTLGSHVEAKRGEMRLSGNVNQSQRNAPDIHGRCGLEPPNHERDEVGAHRHRVRESDDVPRLSVDLIETGAFDLGSVADRQMIDIADQ